MQQPLAQVSGLIELLVPDCARGSLRNGAGQLGRMYPAGKVRVLPAAVAETELEY
jgi:hypothetical protein